MIKMSKGSIHVLWDPFRSQDARGEDGSGGLGCAVGGADDGEYDGYGAAESAEEGLYSFML